MTEQYWDKMHTEKYSKSDWNDKPSLFLEYALQYFPPSGSVLDVGTGQGQDAIHFQRLGYAVTATDYSDVALCSAKEKNNKVNFIKMDTGRGLNFKDNSFDIVYSHMSLHYFDMEITRAIFKNIYKILKPGGVFAMIANTVDDPESYSNDQVAIGINFYKTTKGLIKRYFSLDDIKDLSGGLFDVLMLDNKGETYKDSVKSLIRFIGRKASDS